MISELERSVRKLNFCLSTNTEVFVIKIIFFSNGALQLANKTPRDNH